MISINGVRIATAVMMVRNPCDMYRRKSSVIRTWMTTVIGRMFQVTALSGFRGFRSAGFRIMTAIWPGFLHGDGPGSTMRRGAMLRSITGDGERSALAAHGFQARSLFALFMRPHWWRLSADPISVFRFHWAAV